MEKNGFALLNSPGNISLRIKENDPNLQRAALIEKIKRYATQGQLGFKPEQVSFSGVLVLYNNMLQSLFHFHIHLIPRYKNDGMELSTLNNYGKVNSDEFEKLVNSIKKNIK